MAFKIYLCLLLVVIATMDVQGIHPYIGDEPNTLHRVADVPKPSDDAADALEPKGKYDLCTICNI